MARAQHAGVAARYGARVWLHPSARTRVRRVRELAAPPPGIEVFVPRGVDEGQVAFFLPPERTLVVAELFVGVPGGLRVCPSPATVDEREFRVSLRELQRWEVERVLVAHAHRSSAAGATQSTLRSGVRRAR